MSGEMLLAAAGSGAGRAFAELWPWLAVLLGLVVFGAVALYLARRAVRNPSKSPPGGFTLHELRELRAAGELSDEEFERARSALISGAPPDKPANGDRSVR